MIIDNLLEIKELLLDKSSILTDDEKIRSISRLIYGNDDEKQKVSKIYNFRKSQIDLKVSRFSDLIKTENKRKETSEIMNALYLSKINRTPNQKELNVKKLKITNSLEYDANQLINRYFDERSVSPNDKLMNIVTWVYDLYQDLVYYHPSWKIISSVLTMFEYGFSETSIMRTITRNLKETNDFKHLERCRNTFLQTDSPNIIKKENALNIRAYVPFGTSGYSNVAKNLIKGLFSTGKVNIDLQVVQFHKPKRAE